MLRRNIAALTKCTVGLCVLVAALITGCGMLEETPEQAARRVEAQRQAALRLRKHPAMNCSDAGIAPVRTFWKEPTQPITRLPSMS